jgi:hypothetical protein
MTNQNAFLDHTHFILTKAHAWRRQQATLFPNDASRNEKAAARLFDLAEQTNDISDDIWNRIKPFFNAGDTHYHESVSLCCRQVGFRTNPRTFDDFVLAVIDCLAVSA